MKPNYGKGIAVGTIAAVLILVACAIMGSFDDSALVFAAGVFVVNAVICPWLIGWLETETEYSRLCKNKRESK